VAYAGTHSALIHLGLVHGPYLVAPACVALVAALAAASSARVVRETRAASQLQEQKAREGVDERFRLAVETSPSGVLMVDADGRIMLVNSQTERIFGYSRQELIARPFDLLVPAGLNAAPARERPSAFHERDRGSGLEVVGRRKDASEVPLEVSVVPVPSAQPGVVLASVVDVTERKRKDRELSLQRKELAHLSRATVLGELSGSLAHELNQPLASILSNAQAAHRLLAARNVDTAELREILEDIVREDRRAGDVIRRLRSLLTKGEVQAQPLDLNDLVVDVVKLLHADLISHSVEASVELQPGLPRVKADKIQIQQVLINLIVNASDAMGATEIHGRRLLVRTESLDGAGAHVVVKDTGHGIPADQIEHIFEPFVTSKKHGMGMGLAVCRSIISAHGGTIWAARNDDGGASLHFTIPAMAGQGIP
jgi:two-component system sensor kinase FixL